MLIVEVLMDARQYGQTESTMAIESCPPILWRLWKLQGRLKLCIYSVYIYF